MVSFEVHQGLKGHFLNELRISIKPWLYPFLIYFLLKRIPRFLSNKYNTVIERKKVNNEKLMYGSA